jgi:hypothetical protein
VAGLSTACAPLYDPTFQQIFERTLKPTCAQAGGACHAMDGARGGLIFEDPDRAYQLLLGQDGARRRVSPGDPACSLMVEKLESKDPSFVMPPGAPRPEAERCAIEKWIAAGAAR